MDMLLPLATLALVHLLAAMSPGQSFLLVSRIALASGRGPALFAAVGMGLGALVWAVGALAGLAVIFQQAQWLYAVLKIAGGLYLIYLAVLVWRHAPEPIAVDASAVGRISGWTAFSQAFLTQIANPKVAVFFGSIFVAVLPATPDLGLKAAILAIVLANETVWFALVALMFSAERPRRVYLGAKTWIDRIMAGVLGLIGVRLIADARG